MKKDPLLFVFVALLAAAIVFGFSVNANEKSELRVEMHIEDDADPNLSISSDGETYELTLPKEALHDPNLLSGEIAHLPQTVQDKLIKLFSHHWHDTESSLSKEVHDHVLKVINMHPGKKNIKIIGDMNGEDMDIDVGIDKKVIIKHIKSKDGKEIILSDSDADVIHLADEKVIVSGDDDLAGVVLTDTIVKLIEKSTLSIEDKAKIETALENN